MLILPTTSIKNLPPSNNLHSWLHGPSHSHLLPGVVQQPPNLSPCFHSDQCKLNHLSSTHKIIMALNSLRIEMKVFTMTLYDLWPSDFISFYFPFAYSASLILFLKHTGYIPTSGSLYFQFLLSEVFTFQTFTFTPPQVFVQISPS